MREGVGPNLQGEITDVLSDWLYYLLYDDDNIVAL